VQSRQAGLSRQIKQDSAGRRQAGKGRAIRQVGRAEHRDSQAGKTSRQEGRQFRAGQARIQVGKQC
jgi:hypothetical protein